MNSIKMVDANISIYYCTLLLREWYSDVFRYIMKIFLLCIHEYILIVCQVLKIVGRLLLENINIYVDLLRPIQGHEEKRKKKKENCTAN